ncbi:hypothetical protein Y032_0007g3270 [Ancylostoma ceylanicum]|uniref:Uncharacterized protein n=1 Tax=Ancylostoma ceylanicum TaxID=53326 RepID=A0A016VLR0_9BILA|nr:hypothetical protein Y032_0007g3270 [Ancylostoma ceylanicum]
MMQLPGFERAADRLKGETSRSRLRLAGSAPRRRRRTVGSARSFLDFSTRSSHRTMFLTALRRAAVSFLLYGTL